jgi:hypothetical protein
MYGIYTENWRIRYEADTLRVLIRGKEKVVERGVENSLGLAFAGFIFVPWWRKSI